MRAWVLTGILLISSCAPAPTTGTPPANDLKPYATGVSGLVTPMPSSALSVPQGTVATPTPSLYVVKAGDTLGQIAESFHISLDALLAANPDVNPNGMAIGTKLQIPGDQQNSSGSASPTPASFRIEQNPCYPTADRGVWCFALAHNDSPDVMEDLSAQIELLDNQGTSVGSQTALLPLDILPPDTALPLSVYFPPDVPGGVHAQVQVLTAIRLAPGDTRYLPVVVGNTVVEVDWTGLYARVRGQVTLPAGSKPAASVWVAAVVYDAKGNVVGVRRWESDGGLAAGGSLPFSLAVSSLAGRIGDVHFIAEARP